MWECGRCCSGWGQGQLNWWLEIAAGRAHGSAPAGSSARGPHRKNLLDLELQMAATVLPLTLCKKTRSTYCTNFWQFIWRNLITSTNQPKYIATRKESCLFSLFCAFSIDRQINYQGVATETYWLLSSLSLHQIDIVIRFLFHAFLILIKENI